MDNLVFLIVAIITLLFGLAFLSWGIYQIKTGKMVAKRAKNPVDEPKQVGMLFIYVSLVGFWLTYIFMTAFLSADPAPAISIIFMAISAGFVMTAAIYGLIRKRIFGIKNTVKVAKNVRKHYATVNVATLIMVLAFLTLFSNVVVSRANTFIPVVLAGIILLATFTIVFLLVKIRQDSRK